MITAMQSAKLDAANRLHTARDQVASTIALRCWQPADRQTMEMILVDLDRLFALLISNRASES